MPDRLVCKGRRVFSDRKSTGAPPWLQTSALSYVQLLSVASNLWRVTGAGLASSLDIQVSVGIKASTRKGGNSGVDVQSTADRRSARQLAARIADYCGLRLCLAATKVTPMELDLTLPAHALVFSDAAS